MKALRNETFLKTYNKGTSPNQAQAERSKGGKAAHNNKTESTIPKKGDIFFNIRKGS